MIPQRDFGFANISSPDPRLPDYHIFPRFWKLLARSTKSRMKGVCNFVSGDLFQQIGMPHLIQKVPGLLDDLPAEDT